MCLTSRYSDDIMFAPYRSTQVYIVGIAIRHQMNEDLGTLLNKELTQAGYKTNPDYPYPIAEQPNATEPGMREYYYAWNMAYQYGNILHRRIMPAKRPVLWSKTLLRKYSTGLITASQVEAINIISADSAAGIDLVRFMSCNMEKADFQDTMYHDWKIAHLHLDSSPSIKPHHQTDLVHFTERTGPIVFVFHQDDGLYLLDIMPHGREFPEVWGEKELVEILHRDWPNAIARYRLLGVSEVNYPVTSSAEIIKLRKRGVIYPIQTADGTVYGPFGTGINSAGGSIAALVWADSLFHSCRHYLTQIEQQAQQLADDIDKAIGTRLNELDLTLALSQRNLPVFIEKNTHVALLVSSTAALPPGAIAVNVRQIPTGKADPRGDDFPLRMPA